MAKIELTRSIEAGIPPFRIRQMKAVLGVLRRRETPVSASDLALVVDVVGTADSRKRPVRTVIKNLRDVEGWQICADCHPTKGGYWLARNGDEWRSYLERRAKGARFEFVNIRKMRNAASERNSGQGKLFEKAECGMVGAGG